MFKRFLWLTVGLTIGYGTSFWLMRTVRRTVERLTPKRLATSFGAELRAALEDGRVAMREREAELRAEIERRTG